MIHFAAVGRRAPVDVDVAGVFCTFGHNFQTAAPSEGDAHGASVGSTRVGLFETTSDVDNCETRVGAMIESLDADLVRALTKKYGSDVALLSQKMLFTGAAFGVPQPESFPDDKAFYESWRAFRRTFLDWRDGWEADKRVGVIMSADAYRECGKYDLEAKDWYDRFNARGVKPTAPKTTTPSSLPGILPDTPPNGQTPKGPFDDLLSLVKWLVIGAGVIGAVILVREVA